MLLNAEIEGLKRASRGSREGEVAVEVLDAFSAFAVSNCTATIYKNVKKLHYDALLPVSR
jgi:hypothetical protein